MVPVLYYFVFRKPPPVARVIPVSFFYMNEIQGQMIYEMEYQEQNAPKAEAITGR